MDGLIGDILKTIIAIMLAVALLSILIFFFRLQAIGHYQHAVNGILQESSRAVSTQDQFNGTSSTAHRLNKLDNDYNWMFTLEPRASNNQNNSNNQSNSGSGTYQYGQRIYYTIQVNLPLLNHYSENDYDPNSGQLQKGFAIYSKKLNGQTTCEKNLDNDNN